jgi:predicted dinucleotide-binding enzyme
MIDRRTVLAALGAAVTVRAVARTQAPEKIAILGTGRLGQVLATGWVRAGHRLVYGSRTPEEDRVRRVAQDTGVPAVSSKEATAQSDIVVFALPWSPVRELLPVIGDLSGKIIMDPMNSGRIAGGYVVPDEAVPTSIGEELQALAPRAKVVKAFNTPAARNIVDPARAGGHVSIPLAGEDAAAKARVAALVTDLGLEPVDTGPLIAARYLEAMERLSFGYFVYQKRARSFEFYLAPVKS